MNEIQINSGDFATLTLLLNFVGASIKAVPRIENHWIPFILAAVGGVGHGALAGFTGPNVVVGIVAAATAVGVHQGGRMFVEALKKPDPPVDPPQS